MPAVDRARRKPRGRTTCDDDSCSSWLPLRNSCATFCTKPRADRCFSPIAASAVSRSVKPCAPSSLRNTSEVHMPCTGRPSRRNSFVSSSRPISTASSRRSRLNHWRILLRARGDSTNASQSCDGAADSSFEMKISHVSPLRSSLSSGTRRPFTLAPMHLCPTSVCTAYAKSTGVE